MFCRGELHDRRFISGYERVQVRKILGSPLDKFSLFLWGFSFGSRTVLTENPEKFKIIQNCDAVCLYHFVDEATYNDMQ